MHLLQIPRSWILLNGEPWQLPPNFLSPLAAAQVPYSHLIGSVKAQILLIWAMDETPGHKAEDQPFPRKAEEQPGGVKGVGEELTASETTPAQ